MAGHHVPVAIDVLDVDRHVHGTLAAVDQNRDAAFASDAADLLDRNHRTQRIRHMGDGDELGAVRQAFDEVFDVERAVLVHRRPDKLGALTLTDEVPGNDVGVVLHDRQHDLVTLAELRHAVAIGDRVDRLGGGLGEDDVVGRRGVQEAAHLIARRLIGFRRGIRQEMQAAMDVGIFVGIGMGHRVDHDLWFLRRCAVVEIDKRLAINGSR
ncbi:hypothetical protein D9M72_516440 [compost metagenome]